MCGLYVKIFDFTDALYKGLYNYEKYENILETFKDKYSFAMEEYKLDNKKNI